MPNRIPTRCPCGNLATNQGRCDQHQRKAWANKSANSTTLTGRQRQTLRDQALARDPRCQVCGETNVETLEYDHIIEISDGGSPLDPSNGWLLCTNCHKIKTAHARRARNQRKTRSAPRPQA
jgi:5-methylcytosine-specific restriction protein A